MQDRVVNVITAAQEQIERAATCRNPGTITFYGAQGTCLMLAGILRELADISDKLAVTADDAE